MIQQNDLQFMFDYSRWADQTVLSAAKHLSAEQLTAKQQMGFGSVFETLVHIMAAEEIWLSRWNGAALDSMRPASTYHDLDQLEADWAVVHAGLRDFVATVDTERLHAPLSYKTTQGKPYTEPLFWLIIHMLNHSTEHRTQIAAMCTLAGHDVGSLDVIQYTRHVLPNASE